MCHQLLKVLRSSFIVFCIGMLGLLSFSLPARALDLESQQYFIKELKKDKVLAVSPNFRGDLSQTSLLSSLTEISESYHIRATRAIEAEKLNGKLVPGLIVYVEDKHTTSEPIGMIANKPN